MKDVWVEIEEAGKSFKLAPAIDKEQLSNAELVFMDTVHVFSDPSKGADIPDHMRTRSYMGRTDCGTVIWTGLRQLTHTKKKLLCLYTCVFIYMCVYV